MKHSDLQEEQDQELCCRNDYHSQKSQSQDNKQNFSLYFLLYDDKELNPNGSVEALLETILQLMQSMGGAFLSLVPW